MDNATTRKRAEPGNEAWAPYCLVCSTMARMTETAHGFVCDPAVVDEIPEALRAIVPGLPERRGCGNRIDFDMKHYEAPEDTPHLVVGVDLGPQTGLAVAMEVSGGNGQPRRLDVIEEFIFWGPGHEERTLDVRLLNPPMERLPNMGFFAREIASYVDPASRTGVLAHHNSGGRGGRPSKVGAYKGSKAAKRSSRPKRGKR